MIDQTKEALQYLVGLGEVKIIEVEGQQYSTKELHHVIQPIPTALKATTLTALIDYIKSGMDEKFSKLLIHIVSPKEVKLYSEVRNDSSRECYIVSEALTPSNIIFNRFLNAEDFNIMLQSSFVESDDKDILLKVTGCIQDKAVKEVGDDGVSQAVTIKTGVAKVGDVLVPNPVILAPYRTFPEIEQPESKFIFRMQSGPSAALYEADGGAWRNSAMRDISEYLKLKLQGIKDIEIIY
jgi:hypothetical protein